MDDSLEINKKYKITQALEKIEAKKLKRLESEKKKYEKLFNEQADKLKAKYDKRLERRKNKILRDYDRKRIDTKKKLQGKPVNPKKESIKKRKQKAFSEVCKFSKLMRADDFGMVLQVDTGKRVHRSECVGGHIYPKGNFSHMAFNLDNIRPISSYGNKKQLDSIADRLDKVPLPQFVKDTLKEQSTNQLAKNQLRDTPYYKNLYEVYLCKNMEEKQRLGKYYEKNLLTTK